MHKILITFNIICDGLQPAIITLLSINFYTKQNNSSYFALNKIVPYGNLQTWLHNKLQNYITIMRHIKVKVRQITVKVTDAITHYSTVHSTHSYIEESGTDFMTQPNNEYRIYIQE